MKYNININQLALSNTDLDLKDCAILEYLTFLCNSKNEKIENQRVEGYTWIDYGRLIEDMPLLRIKSANSITPRINKIKENGFLKTKLIRVNGHKRLLVKLTELIDTLVVEVKKPNRENEKPNREIVVNNNTINNKNNNHAKSNFAYCNFLKDTNNSLKELPFKEKEKVAEKEKENIPKIFDLFRDSINPVIKYENLTAIKDCDFLLNKFGFESVKKITEEAIAIQGEKFAPTISNPSNLRNKWVELNNYLNKKTPIKNSKKITEIEITEEQRKESIKLLEKIKKNKFKIKL